MQAMARENEQDASRLDFPGNSEEMTDEEPEAFAEDALSKNTDLTGGGSFPDVESWLDREARVEEEILAMSESELDEIVNDYPKDTPTEYKKIGFENFFD